MILERLDPDELHPGRLGGAHAWATWDLTEPPADDRHVQLLVPERDQHRVTGRILDRIVYDLERPTWPPRPPLAAEVIGHEVQAHGSGQTATITVTSHPWYLPARAGPPCTEVVDTTGWPIADEFTALRERIAAISPSAPTATDLADLERWTATKASNGSRRPAAGASLDELLARVRRETPETATHLRRVLDAARCHRVHLPNNGQITGPLGYLSHQLTPRAHARSR